jgi:metal-responsive CopG/Arc/MetJ family transcriptional regulator
MRTTITLADDVSAAVDEVMRRDHIGRSEAVNELIRAGLTRRATPARYTHRSHPMGMQVDVANIGEVLDLIEHWDDADGAGATGAG